MDCTGPVPLCPQEGHHFSKNAHAAASLRRLFDERSKHLSETCRLQLSIDHEAREGRGGVEGDVRTLCLAESQIQPFALQLLPQAFPVGPGGDHDAGLSRAQAGAHEDAHCLDERGIILTEMYHMRMSRHFRFLRFVTLCRRDGHGSSLHTPSYI